MDEQNKCRCPMCEQTFSPEKGLTPEEHLAKGVLKVFGEMQQKTRDFPCPRCGNKRMLPTLEKNAVSRYSDIYICPVCAIDEEVRDANNNPLSFSEWRVVAETLKSTPDLKCADYVPEKDNPYPLCDNPQCERARECNISAHMKEPSDY